MPALEIDQPTINVDFYTVGSQLIQLNQAEDSNNNNNNNNSNSNANEDSHIDINTINNEIYSDLLELQNLLSVDISCENMVDYAAADTFNKALIDFKKYTKTKS